jgi:hypothetical protein
VASSNGLPVKEITLFALGGVSQIEKTPLACTGLFALLVGELQSPQAGRRLSAQTLSTGTVLLEIQ